MAPASIPSPSDPHSVANHVLHISDCHLAASGDTLLGMDTSASLDAVLRQALSERQPDAVIATGDLAHLPLAAVYARFLDTVRAHTQAPLLCLPGNHDVLGAMQAAGLPLTPLLVGCWSILALDSHEDDAPRALVREQDLLHVDAQLQAAPGVYVLVATHHPPVAVNCPWLDKDRIQNPQELLEWLSERSARQGAARLRGVVFGHAHQAVDDVCSGVPVFGAPSTCFQFAPNSSSFSIDAEPPGYRWLRLGDDGSLVSRTCWVTGFPVRAQLKD